MFTAGEVLTKIDQSNSHGDYLVPDTIVFDHLVALHTKLRMSIVV